MAAKFSVYQFFKDDGGHERVRELVEVSEAMEAFKHYTTSVGAKLGVTVRVIITDGDDFTTMEWKFDEGLTFPPQLVEKWNRIVYGDFLRRSRKGL